jgi:PAP2 superfamily
MYPAIPHISGWRRQLLLFAAAYLAYSLGRFVALGDEPVATANARWIVDLEDTLELGVEGGVQRALDSGVVMWLLNHAYLAAQPLAAVPSLHAGFAFAVSAAGFAAARRPLARAAALAWSPIVALAVVATGNHFVFDIAAGAVITAAGYALARTLAGWRPAVSLEPAAGLVHGARRPLPQRG